MGQFDNIIPVKVTSGKTVTTASVSAPKKPVVVDKKTGEEITRTYDINGGTSETAIPLSGAKAIKIGEVETRKKVKSVKANRGIAEGSPVVRKALDKNLRSTTMRPDNKGGSYDTEDVKINRPAPVVAGTHPAPARRPLGDSGALAPMKVSNKKGKKPKAVISKTPLSDETTKALETAKEREDLRTTTMRWDEEKDKAYDETYTPEYSKMSGNTKIRLGGQQFLDDKDQVRNTNTKGAEEQFIPTTVNDKTGSGTSKVTGQTPIMDTPKKYVEHNIPEVAYDEKGKVSGSWDDPTSVLSTTMREEDAGPAVQVDTAPKRSGTSPSKYVKPEVTDPKAGQVFPISSLNTNWNDSKVTRGPQRGTKELDLNKAPTVKLPGQTAAQQRADASRAATRTSAPARELGYDPAKVHQHALTMAIRDNVSLGDMSSDSFKGGYHHTKAKVMALGGLHPEDEALLNKHLGSGSNHTDNLKAAYEHLTSRNRFNETSKPGKGTEYSGARGNIDVSAASKDYYVPKGSNSLVHASKLGSKSLEGSTVAFDGYVPNTGSDKDTTPYHAVTSYQGYHPDKETHPVTGERVRVFRHHDVPQGAIHLGDVDEEAMKSGKSMYRYEKQARMQRDASRGPSQESRSSHAGITRSIIDQHTSAEADARLPSSRPEGGQDQITYRQAGSDKSTIKNMSKEQKDFRAKQDNNSKGKFVEIDTPAIRHQARKNFLSASTAPIGQDQKNINEAVEGGHITPDEARELKTDASRSEFK